MRQLLLFFLLFNSTILGAAEPAYFMLGEKQFEGVDIYSIVQDKEYNYWFATDNGLYVHDGYSFEQIDASEMKSLSMFGLVLHENGDVFCFNLNRQVFRIRDKKCTVFFEIPEPANDISILISHNNEIVISTSSQIFVLDPSANLIATYQSKSGKFQGPGYQVTNNDIIFSSGNIFQCIIYSNKKFTETNIDYPSEHPTQLPVFRFFKHRNETFALDLNTKNVFAYHHAEKNSAFVSTSKSIPNTNTFA